MNSKLRATLASVAMAMAALSVALATPQAGKAAPFTCETHYRCLLTCPLNSICSGCPEGINQVCKTSSDPGYDCSNPTPPWDEGPIMVYCEFAT